MRELSVITTSEVFLNSIIPVVLTPTAEAVKDVEKPEQIEASFPANVNGKGFTVIVIASLKTHPETGSVATTV